jgi:hypothetical protein
VKTKQQRSGNEKLRRIPLRILPFSFLLAVLLVACLQAPLPVSADDTGITGTALWGPVEPGPARIGQSDEAPFRALFQVRTSGKVVARFESDENGYFKVLLPPGEYRIIPDKSAPIPYPDRQTKDVTVPEDGFANVTLRFDTGMR